MKLFFSVLLFSIASFCKAQNEVDIAKYIYQLEVGDKDDVIKGEADVLGTFRQAGNQLTLDLKNTNAQKKGMTVQQVNGTGVSGFKHNNDQLIVSFQKPFQVKDSFRIKIIYYGIPADGLIISKNKYGDRTFFSDNWPNRARHWIPCNDRPDDKARFEFIVTAPSHYSVISNGVRIEEKETIDGKKRTHYREDTPLPTKVMAVGIAKFATKTFANSPKVVPVSAWVYPKDSTKGFYDYALTPEILNFFSEYVAPYPYKKLANVQSKTVFGGMENASAIFYAEGSVTGDRKKEDLLAHEIAHQWFGDMASEKSFAHLWLSEGFANFLTNYYFEKKYGKEAANERWKDQRDEVIEFAKTSQKPVVDSSSDLMSLLNANSYEKGAWFLHMLRNEVGDQIFQKIIQTYYSQYKGSNAETRDFEEIAEKVSGKELTWFFDQWLYRPGVPELKMSTALQNDEFSLTVKQQRKPYRLTLEVDIVGKDNEITRHRFAISKNEETFTVAIKATSAQFSLDPETKLLYKLAD
ncbi:MAG: M1 family peptidase [Pedobacter sp.]|nr:MAG: M1 family peptidase [Pedobacter sp.]